MKGEGGGVGLRKARGGVRGERGGEGGVRGDRGEVVIGKVGLAEGDGAGDPFWEVGRGARGSARS